MKNAQNSTEIKSICGNNQQRKLTLCETWRIMSNIKISEQSRWKSMTQNYRDCKMSASCSIDYRHSLTIISIVRPCLFLCMEVNMNGYLKISEIAEKWGLSDSICLGK